LPAAGFPARASRDSFLAELDLSQLLRQEFAVADVFHLHPRIISGDYFQVSVVDFDTLRAVRFLDRNSPNTFCSILFAHHRHDVVRIGAGPSISGSPVAARALPLHVKVPAAGSRIFLLLRHRSPITYSLRILAISRISRRRRSR